MMSNRAFKRAAVFTDLHIGLKSNHPQHNQDCLNFVQWFVDTAREQQCDVAIVCGDYHNHRNSINILSLNYSLKCLELLNRSFSTVYFLVGNHDLYYRQNRNVNSVEFAKYLDNIVVVNDVLKVGDDVTFLPWLLDNELAICKKLNTKYVFGHLELGGFYMNSQVLMPDHGEINDTWFSGAETVFTGHFHRRQSRKNIHYIGNAFPHNYSDAGDDARGMMILEWGAQPQYITWPDQPRFRVLPLSQVIDNPAKYLARNMHARLTIDIKLSYEEANYVRDNFVSEFEMRELVMIPPSVSENNTTMFDEAAANSLVLIQLIQLSTVL